MLLRICFVCGGNTCRSPMAQAVFSRLAADAGLAGRVEAAGAGCEPDLVGGPADPRALAALARRGHPLPDHRARRFEPADFDRYHLVIAMEADHLRHLTRLARSPQEVARIRLLRTFDIASVAADELDVADPFRGEETTYEYTLDLIETCCRGLLAALHELLAALPE